MAVIKKFPETLTQNLTTFQTYLVDTNANSTYFKVTEFKDTFTGGKNGFLIEGSPYLMESTEIKIEILDVAGNAIYYEPGNGVPEYYEGTSKLVAVYIYEDTPIGTAKITILGELKTYLDEGGLVLPIPDEWKNVYNVKWEKSFQVNKLLSNEDKVRFYRRPEVTINEIVKPIFSNVVTPITQKGFVDGFAQVPGQGERLAEYSLPTNYLLQINDGGAWTGSVVGTTIELTDLGLFTVADDVINKTDLTVKTPYTLIDDPRGSAFNGTVQDFSNQRYTASFSYVEGLDQLKTALTGSFGKITISDLETFVGDVARVKIFRKSQSDLADYQFIQEIQLESNELLKDLESKTKNEEFYGIFDQFNFKSQYPYGYWVTSSNNLTASFNQNYLYNSVKLDSNGINKFFTSKSLEVTENTEYTLTFNVRLGNQTISTNDYVSVYLSGSRQSTFGNTTTNVGVQQNILTVTEDNSLLQKSQITANFKAEKFNNTKLYFDVKGNGWYISDVSLRASQESSFSPNEISFIQPIPRTLPKETFDFLFQFYDINNNYIPVVVEESKTFDGGNLNRINKSIELVPSSLYFQFDSGSGNGNPVNPTTIFIDVVKNFLTGSVTFTSRSFDFFNTELSSSAYDTLYWATSSLSSSLISPPFTTWQFPGKLLDTDKDTVRLTVQNFTGSRDPGLEEILVQYIEYTAKCEGVEDSIIITRVIDGKGGVNYEIRPYNGTVIRNSDSSSALEVQAIRIDGVNEINLRNGLPAGRSNIKLHVQSGSRYITLSEASGSGWVKGLKPGITGSGIIDYNAIFNRDSIDGQRTVYMIPVSQSNPSASILTAITLTDLQDGLDAGIVLYDADTFNINPRTENKFRPIFSSATASFFRRGQFDSPLSCSFEVYPSMSINNDFVPEYWIQYVTHSCDPTISVVAYDEAGNIIPSRANAATYRLGNRLQQTKQLLTSFVYTEPWTSASVSVDHLFQIIPDGKPGDESIVFEVNPANITLAANSKGIVNDYKPTISEIKLKQGSRYLAFTGSRKPGTFHIATASIIAQNITGGLIYFDNAYTESLIVSASFNMVNLSGSITYPLEIQPYYTSSVYTASVVQQYTKVLDGPQPIQILINPLVSALKADEVGYVTPVNYSSANTAIQVREGDDTLFYSQSRKPGTWKVNKLETSSSLNLYNIRTGSLTSSLNNLGANVTFNRFDYPYVSASAFYTIEVFPYSLGPGHEYTSSIYTRTQTFTKTVAPPNARSVDFKASSYTVNYNRDGVVTEPEGDITLTATAFNTTGSVFYRWYYIDYDGSEVPYQGPDPETTPNSKESSISVGGSDAAGPGENKTWKVKIWDGDSDGNSPIAAGNKPVRAEAQLTIAGIKAGADSYKIVSSNDNTSVSATLFNTNLSGTGMKITTFKGVTQLTNVNAGTYNVANDVYDYLGSYIGNLGFSSASIYSKSSWITMAGTKFPTSNPASIGNLTFWDKPAINKTGEIVYRVDFENNRQVQFVTQSFAVQFTEPAPYDAKMQNENTSIVYRVSGEVELGSTSNIIRAYRGNYELTNKPSGFTGVVIDAYGSSSYEQQCQVEITSISSHLTLLGGLIVGSKLPGSQASMAGISAWDSPETNLTGEIVYGINCEGRQTLYKTQSISVQFEGATGPGIVMRGEWSPSTDYIGSVETSNNRRDAVTYLATTDTVKYYAAISGSGPATYDNNSVLVNYHTPTVDGDNDWWQYLGDQEFFVAAKIAIFEESYVKNTINVGTKNGTGAFANIVIAGGRTDPYIAIGQNATVGSAGTSGTSLNPGGAVIGYERPGIFLGIYEQPIGSGGTSGRFSIVNGAGTRYLKWDGSALEIAGNIRIKNVATARDGGKMGAFDNGDSHDSGEVGGWELAADAIYSGTKNLSGYNAGAGITLAAAGSIHSKNFYIDTTGDAFFKGTLSAAGGTFSGDISAASGTFGGTVTVGTAPNQIVLSGGQLTGPGFVLNSSGLTVSDATISGTISATAGSIGSWTVENNILRDASSRIFLDPSLPGLAIKESGTTKLKVNFGELTDLAGGTISLTAESLSEYQTPAASTSITISIESDGVDFNVPGGTYTDSSVVWPNVGTVVDAYQREGNLDLNWGYRIYEGATIGTDFSGTLISEVSIGSTYWNGGVDDSFASISGYTGTFQFSPPNAGATTYTFKTFFEASGYSYNTGYGYGGSGYLSINYYTNTPAISAVANLDIVELTNKGIQIATSADRYIRLRRENSASIPLLDGKGFISLIGDAANTLIQLSGTTTGTAINIAASTGKIAMNGNNIEMGTGVVSWNPGGNAGAITTHTVSGTPRPTVQMVNIPGSGDLGGTIRDMEFSLSQWKLGRNTSARRYKEDIQNWTHPSLLEAVNNTPIRSFYWKVDAEKEHRPQQIGVIAEELESAGLEEFVDYDWFDDTDNPEGPKKWMTSGIAKGELVFVLWKAVQELTQKVKDLENKLSS
jgi:hypothetical protein